MKALNKLLWMEMSNIYICKPSKNVRKKECFVWVIFFVMVMLYGWGFLTQIKKTEMVKLSVGYVYVMSLVAAVYDYSTRIKNIMYDYAQYQAISYLPVKTSQILSAKIITSIVVTIRWMITVGISYSMIYLVEQKISFPNIVPILLVYLVNALWIPLMGNILENYFYVCKWKWGLLLLCEIPLTCGIIFRSFQYLQKEMISFVDIGVCLIVIAIEMIGFYFMIKRMGQTYQETLTKIEWNRQKKINNCKHEYGSSSKSAMYHKEKKAFYSFKMYVVNTVIPIIILSLLLIVACFIPKELILEVFEKTGSANLLLDVIPLLPCFVFGIANPTYCGISLEGKAFPVLKSKPIQFKQILCAKRKVYIILCIPFVIIDSVCVVYAMDREWMIGKSILCMLLTLGFLFLISTIGILLDILFGSTQWENPVSVVKQSITMPLQMLCSSVLIGMPVGLRMCQSVRMEIIYGETLIFWILIGIGIHTITLKVAKKKIGL